MAGIRRVKGTAQQGKQPLSPNLCAAAGGVCRSKTEPEGEGHTAGIPYGSHPESCPVKALENWLERSGITAGHLFTAIGR